MRTAIFLFPVAAIACGLLGCAGKDNDLSRQSNRLKGDAISKQFEGVSYNALRPVANRAFRDHFTIDRDASTPDIWISDPVELTAQEKKQAHLVLRTSPRHRRLGELQILEDADGAIVRCHVRIERLDTLAREAFAAHRGDDRPTETPIDRRHGSQPGTYEHWTYVTRDKKLEQQILADITAEIEGTTP